MPKLLPAPSVPVEAFLTPSEVLIRLRVNVRTLYRLIKHGELPAVRVGRQWRVSPGGLEVWLRRNGLGAPPASAATGMYRRSEEQNNSVCHPATSGVMSIGDL